MKISISVVVMVISLEERKVFLSLQGQITTKCMIQFRWLLCLPVGMIDLFSDLGPKPPIWFFRLSKQQSICTPRWININNDHKMLCCGLLYTVNTQSTHRIGAECAGLVFIPHLLPLITPPLSFSPCPLLTPPLFSTYLPLPLPYLLGLRKWNRKECMKN